MSRVFCALCLWLFTFLSYGQDVVSWPTKVPDSAQAQQALMHQLLALPVAQRSPQQWRQLSIVAVALLGDADSLAAKEAEAILRQAHDLYPQDAEIMAVQGSLFCIQAGSRNINSTQAMTLANKGFRQLDRAVLTAPEQLGPRLQRAITASRAPVFLGKRPVAREDFTYLLSAVPASPQTQVLRAMLLYQLGELSQQDKLSTIALWQQAAALQGGIWSKRAKEQLAR